MGEYLGPPPELVGEYLGPPPELVGEYLGPPPELVGEKQACPLNIVFMSSLPFRLMCNNTIQQTAQEASKQVSEIKNWWVLPGC